MASLLSRRELLILAAGAAAGGCSLFPREDAALARAKVEALAQMEKGFFTGAAFARSDRGEAGYVGWQGRGPETGAVDARTLFDAASLTKTIVAAVLALQVVEGRLDPDAPFIRYLPDHACAFHDGHFAAVYCSRSDCNGKYPEIDCILVTAAKSPSA